MNDERMTALAHRGRTFPDGTRFQWWKVRRGTWRAEQYGEGGIVTWTDRASSERLILAAINERRATPPEEG